MGKTKDSRRNNFLLQGGILAIAGIVVRPIEYRSQEFWESTESVCMRRRIRHIVLY